MATRQEIIWVCDFCGIEKADVRTHVVVVDNHAIELDACAGDWQSVMASLADVDRVGRPPKRLAAKRSRAVPFPGESWLFTHHALEQMGKRKLQPKEVVEAAERPEITHPGEEPELEVRIGRGIKVVVNPSKRSIITASYREE